MPFKTGQSGNPTGKPKGAKDKRTELRELLKPHAPELVEKVVQMAKDGDTAALRICIDRLIPPIKAAEEPVRLEGFDGTLSEQGQSILRAMGEGKLASSQAATLLQALAAQTRIIEAEELERRVRALEQNQ